MTHLLSILTAFLPLLQDAPDHRLTVELIAEKDGTFVLRGTTDLPEGTALGLAISRGHGPPRLMLHERVVTVAEGRFALKVRPWEKLLPGAYRGRVHFSATFQQDLKIRQQLLESGRKKRQSAETIVWNGTLEDFNGARREQSLKLAREMQKVVRHCREGVRKTRAVIAGSITAEAYRESTGRLYKEILKIEEQNYGRLDLRYLGLSDLADHGIEKLRHKATRLFKTLDTIVTSDEVKDKTGAVSRTESVILASLEREAHTFFEKLDFVPEGSEGARLMISSLAKELSRLKKEILNPEGPDSERVSPEQVRGTLMRLAGKVPRSHYSALERVSEGFEAVFAEEDPAAKRKLLEDLDSRLQTLKEIGKEGP